MAPPVPTHRIRPTTHPLADHRSSSLPRAPLCLFHPSTLLTPQLRLMPPAHALHLHNSALVQAPSRYMLPYEHKAMHERCMTRPGCGGCHGRVLHGVLHAGRCCAGSSGRSAAAAHAPTRPAAQWWRRVPPSTGRGWPPGGRHTARVEAAPRCGRSGGALTCRLALLAPVHGRVGGSQAGCGPGLGVARPGMCEEPS